MPTERMDLGEVMAYVAPDADDLLLPGTLDGGLGRSPFQPPTRPAGPAHSVREAAHLADVEDGAARQRLAEEMRRILVEEARRHGIDV
jgi:hypothetical protein